MAKENQIDQLRRTGQPATQGGESFDDRPPLRDRNRRQALFEQVGRNLLRTTPLDFTAGQLLLPVTGRVYVRLHDVPKTLAAHLRGVGDIPADDPQDFRETGDAAPRVVYGGSV